MASLRALPDSKNLIACFTDINGRRRQRSTGTHVRKDAQRIADGYESAARTLKTEAQIRRVIAELYEQVGGTPLASGSVQSFLADWLKRKESENAAATVTAYRAAVQRFLAHLGARAALDLNYVTAADILSFRDDLAAKLSPASANTLVKIIRVAFNAAMRAGLMPTNPALQVENVRRGRSHASEGHGARRAFSIEELQRVLVAAEGEWKGLILFGLYTGQRLGDLCRLTWGHLDLPREELRFVTGKTNRQIILPLPKPLLKLIDGMTPGTARTPLFPKSAKAAAAADGRVGALSNQFYDVLVKAGLVQPRSHQSTGKGRSGRREFSEVSFHSLRHTATSLLKNAGVSDVVAREFIGHDSAAVSRHYTHIQTSTLREAAEKMPDLTSADQ